MKTNHLREYRKLEADRYIAKGLYLDTAKIYEDLDMKSEYKKAWLLQAGKYSSEGMHLNAATIYKMLGKDRSYRRAMSRHKNLFNVLSASNGVLDPI